MNPMELWIFWMKLWLLGCLGAWILEKAITHAFDWYESRHARKLPDARRVTLCDSDGTPIATNVPQKTAARVIRSWIQHRVVLLK